MMMMFIVTVLNIVVQFRLWYINLVFSFVLNNYIIISYLSIIAFAHLLKCFQFFKT